MKDFATLKHFEPAEKLVEVLMQKTQNSNPNFFRISVAYYFAKVASMMRCDIDTHDRGLIPVSLYAMNLASSGHGKGHSTNIIEDQVVLPFREKFLNETFPIVSAKHIARLALKRAAKYQLDDDEMLEKLNKEFEGMGTLAFSFDSGTTAAIKQMRHKLLMANAGSVNFEMDELGSNLLGNVEALTVFLELYDVGKVKPKLVKNTMENKRVEEIEGRTPTNLLLYGTPAKVLNGGKAEEELMAMFETGYARRCFFGFDRSHNSKMELSPLEIYDMTTSKASSKYLDELAQRLTKLADPVNFNIKLEMSKKVSLLLIEYKLNCEKRANAMREHEDVKKAEISHRYYKALKLAGAYAFVDGAKGITEDHLYCAIKLAEESGEAFSQLLTRDRNYVKLAKYIADVDREITQVDLVEDLPFYKGSESQRRDLMSLAVAWGYKHNIIIKKSYSEGIEFLKGESMAETDLSKMTLSYSTDIAMGYKADHAPFDSLHKVTSAAGHHYTAHHFKEGHRISNKAIPGFNMVMIDVDEGISLSAAQLLLSDYKCFFATTKKHTAALNRFRIIFPLTHEVKLGPEEYAKFMENVFAWLPFKVDPAPKDIARKWESFKGEHHYQEGKLLDAMLFIPETRKEEQQAKRILDSQSMTNLERWFALNTSNGNRSNQLVKYALALVDNGYDIEGVRRSVMDFNSKLKEGLPEAEISATIMMTASRAITVRETNKQ